MRNFQEKRGWRGIMQSKISLVFLGVVIVVLTWSVIGLFRKRQETIRNKIEVEDKIMELEETKQRLSTDIEKLTTEKGKEESIREKFGWVKEGEGVIIVVEDENTTNEEGGKKSKGFFSFFKNLFQ